MWSSHTYHEPSPTLLVILTSFLYFLNLFGWIAQETCSAGLLGQILIGIIYGTPVAGWLPTEYEEAIVGIGYVGLLIVVFEGGMTTSLDALVQLLPLSVCVALTGLLTPIALSFILAPAFGFPLIHAFAAGSALSSTSLGTILTVLQPRVIGFDLRKTKLGVVLLSAAVMDDVVAFIFAKLLSIIGSEGGSNSSALGEGIGRAIGVTVGLAVVFVPIAKWVLDPLYNALMAGKARWADKKWGGQAVVLCVMAVLWIGMIAASGYGGTSPLYGVYLAGLITSYLQRTRDPSTHAQSPCDEAKFTPNEPTNAVNRASSFPFHAANTTLQLGDRPIPVNLPGLLDRSVLAPPPSLADSDLKSTNDSPVGEHDPLSFHDTFETYLFPVMTYLLLPLFFASIGYSIPFVALWTGQTIWRGIVYAILMILAKAITGVWLVFWPIDTEPGEEGVKGWRAGLFLGLAMVARGEIGLLISQIAYHTSEPLFSEPEFLVVIWAILLATIIGPIGAGWVIKRWKKDVLQGGWA